MKFYDTFKKIFDHAEGPFNIKSRFASKKRQRAHLTERNRLEIVVNSCKLLCKFNQLIGFYSP